MATHKTEGLRLMRGFFRDNKTAIKAGEARALGFSSRQTLDHIIQGNRKPTLEQATAIENRYGIATSEWGQKPKGGKI